MRRLLSNVGIVITAAACAMWLAPAACLAERPAQPHPFLTRFCLDCHSADDPSGEREFTSLDFAGSGIDTQIRLQEIIDQLTLEAMPPEDAEQPSESERLQAIGRFTEMLTRMRRETRSTGGRTVLRRLTRREYRNTVADLLGIDVTMFDPTLEFPDDDLSEGFDNIGHDLTTSGFLLEKYLEAADACIEKAFAGERPVEPQTWVFRDNFFQQPELGIAHRKAFQFRYLVLYDHPRNEKPEGAYGPLNEFPDGVPADGIYRVRVRAQALHRDTPYSTRAVMIDTSEPFRMGIRPGDTRIGDMVHTQPIEPKFAEAVITDNELRWYTFEIPLDRGFAPRFTFENGQHDVRGSYGRIFRFHRDTLPESLRQGKGIVAWRNAVTAHGYLPQIRIHEVEIHGPLPTSPQPDAFRKLVGGETFTPSAVSELLRDFASRAFRRPVSDSEVSGLVALYEQRVAEGRPPLEAYKDALKAVLCAPGFLYFTPPDEPAESPLDHHALAERLAYFLTSSMPDDRLRQLADESRIAEATVLRAEAIRLLETESSGRFIADFLDSWLKLRALGSMPPDPATFREYYSAGLQPEMKQESRLFMRDLIDRNASVLEFLSARHSFVNRDLAKLYGVEDQISPEQAGDFHRVVFDDANRGGLLGQASILTVSANGIETSPVVRGVWLLETVLGTPPPPPPDDVPPIDPDIRGTTSIREQLARHRELATCNQCHRKIDPLGFALEGFDPIGRSRSYYDRRQKIPIDTSGVLPGGKTFRGPAELREVLLERKEFFVRTVTERLVTHALGRHIESTDRAAIDQILEQVRDDAYPLRDLIVVIVMSDLFRR
ncbi:hypothetical protein Mal4_38520 [Maioricimonas rarisocia]|uniref:Planctomycete cytochrome C n=1 Tax=Maioricimonas rarisocia TaxID=2528026 RepID=A0A517ZAM4_9PLAN|nr:DUF1592 domain-containing protein [Maioricimonas rarisocia]QDU39507.1 hypothetical protein Mal4_38520 [Maioricimonas rarisocia]